MGILKTRAAMSSRFYWLGMTVDINNWVGYVFELLLCSVFCVLLTTTFLKVLECDKCQKVGKPLTAAKQLQCIQVHMYSGILILSNGHQERSFENVKIIVVFCFTSIGVCCLGSRWH